MDTEFIDIEPRRPPPDVADEIERRDLLAMLPAVVEFGDLDLLLWVRRRLRVLGRRAALGMRGDYRWQKL